MENELSMSPDSAGRPVHPRYQAGSRVERVALSDRVEFIVRHPRKTRVLGQHAVGDDVTPLCGPVGDQLLSESLVSEMRALLDEERALVEKLRKIMHDLRVESELWIERWRGRLGLQDRCSFIATLEAQRIEQRAAQMKLLEDRRKVVKLNQEVLVGGHAVDALAWLGVPIPIGVGTTEERFLAVTVVDVPMTADGNERRGEFLVCDLALTHPHFFFDLVEESPETKRLQKLAMRCAGGPSAVPGMSRGGVALQ